jgi:uncharacterized membrane protein
MVEGWVHVAVVIALVGCAVMSGIFFAFSNFMMQALRRLPPAQGVAAMQSINVAIVTPLFVLALLGTAAACVVLAVAGVLRLDDDGAPLVLTGSLLYLVGCMAVTIGYHIPRNQGLDRLDAATPEAAAYWARFVPRWTAGNHLRTLASVGAVIAFALALG